MAKGRFSATDTSSETHARERFQSFQVSQLSPMAATTARAINSDTTQRRTETRAGCALDETMGR